MFFPNYFVALAAAGAAIALFYPALHRGRTSRLMVLAVAIGAAISAPFLLEGEILGVRAMTVIVLALVVIKLFDLHVGASRGFRPGLREYLWFLTNLGVLVLRRSAGEPFVSPVANGRRLLLGLGQVALGIALLRGLFLISFSEHSFWTEHTFISIGFFIGVIGLFRITAVLSRLMFGVAREPTNNAILARTPADFWRRYNRVVQQFLYEDIFRPANGRRHPVSGILLVFALSGLIHEYLFSTVAGRFQGYQSAFFLVQGAAVALTIRVRPRGWAAIPAIALTFGFNVVTGVLFLASLNQIVEFYANPLPAWLAGW